MTTIILFIGLLLITGVACFSLGIIVGLFCQMRDFPDDEPAVRAEPIPDPWTVEWEDAAVPNEEAAE